MGGVREGEVPDKGRYHRRGRTREGERPERGRY